MRRLDAKLFWLSFRADGKGLRRMLLLAILDGVATNLNARKDNLVSPAKEDGHNFEIQLEQVTFITQGFSEKFAKLSNLSQRQEIGVGNNSKNGLAWKRHV